MKSSPSGVHLTDSNVGLSKSSRITMLKRPEDREGPGRYQALRVPGLFRTLDSKGRSRIRFHFGTVAGWLWVGLIAADSRANSESIPRDKVIPR